MSTPATKAATLTLAVLVVLSANAQATPRGNLFDGIEGAGAGKILDGFDGDWMIGRVRPERRNPPWTEDPPTYRTLDPVVPRQDERLAVCWWPTELDLDPRVPPPESARAAGVHMVAARQQYETATLVLYAFADCTGLDARVEGLDLTAQCRFSKWMWNASGERRHAPRESELVLGPRELPAGRATRLWCRVWCGESTRTGDHSGTLVISAGSQTLARLPLNLRVLPLVLPEPPVDHGFWYGPAWAWPNHHGANVPKHFAQMREYGMNTVVVVNVMPTLGVDVQGRVTADWSPVDRVVHAYREAGLDGPVGIDGRVIAGWCSAYGRARDAAGGNTTGPGAVSGWEHPPAGYAYLKKPYPSAPTQDAFRQVMQNLRQHAAASNWPESWVYVQEEATSHAESMEQLRYFSPLLRKSGIKSYLVSNAPWWSADEVDQMGDLWDVRAYNFHTKSLAASAQANGRILAGYNCLGDGPRMAWGFWACRAGLKHVTQWSYQWHGAMAMAAPAKDGPVPSPMLEQLRRGIDDARYVAAIPEPARSAFLRFLRRRIPLHTRTLIHQYGPANHAAGLTSLRLAAARMAMGEEVELDRWPGPQPPPEWEFGRSLVHDLRFKKQGTHRQQIDLAPFAGQQGILRAEVRSVSGDGSVNVRLRCRLDKHWRDVMRVQVDVTDSRAGVVEWVNGDAWGYRGVTRARGRRLELESQGRIPKEAAQGELSIEIAPRDGQPFDAELDAVTVRTAAERAPAILPFYNLVTRGERFLPILIPAERPNGLTVRLDDRVLCESLPPGNLRTVIALADLAPGTHTLSLEGDPGDVAHCSAFTIFPER